MGNVPFYLKFWVKVTALAQNRRFFISERELKFMFAICRRPSVCLSVVCQSVTFVRPTQAIEIFGIFS